MHAIATQAAGPDGNGGPCTDEYNQHGADLAFPRNHPTSHSTRGSQARSPARTHCLGDPAPDQLAGITCAVSPLRLERPKRRTEGPCHG